MKKLLLILLGLILGTLLGGYLGTVYFAKGEVILSMCTMGDIATKNSYLTKQQLLSLAEKTGQELTIKYPLVAKHLLLDEASIGKASEQSDCSQLLVSLSKGINGGK